MKSALIYHLAEKKYVGTEPVQATKLSQDDVDRYKRLGYVFACVCRGQDQTLPPPVLNWVKNHGAAGEKSVRRHFSMAAGTIEQHALHCEVRENYEPPKEGPQLRLNEAITIGYPVIAYLNMKGGVLPYQWRHHAGLDQLYGRGLTRPISSVDNFTWRTKNCYMSQAVNGAHDLVTLMTKMVDRQSGSLNNLMLSQGGGVWPLLKSYFDPTRERDRRALTEEVVRAWYVIGQMQGQAIKDGKSPKDWPTKLALPPRLVLAVMSREEQAKQLGLSEGQITSQGVREFKVRGHIKYTRIENGGHVLGYDLVSRNQNMHGQVKNALWTDQSVLLLATPTVIRAQSERTEQPPRKLNLEFPVLEGMVCVEPLPSRVGWALRQPYETRAWRQAIAREPGDRSVRVQSSSRRHALAPTAA